MSELGAKSVPSDSEHLRVGEEHGSGGLGHTAEGMRPTAHGGRPEACGLRHTAGRGFTLLELLVTVAVIAILAGLTLGVLGHVNKKSAESRARSEVAALAAAIDAYKLELGVYPEDDVSLYAELTGQGTNNQSTSYIEPPYGMVNTNTRRFVDPWGINYGYTTNAEVNIGFYDLWSTAGGAASNNWIRN